MLNKATAVELTRAYFEAMASKDIEKLLDITDDKVTITSPLGKLEGIQAFREFQEGFFKMIEKLVLVALYGDDTQAVLVYNSDTLPVKGAIVAEYVKVEGGKLVSSVVIYDSAPFAAYAASVQPH